MTRTVKLSAPAGRDLRTARNWLIQPGSGWKARARYDAISDAIKDLRLAPCMWPMKNHPPHRERVVEGHRIMYVVEPDTDDNRTAGNIRIIRILGPGQEVDLP